MVDEDEIQGVVRLMIVRKEYAEREKQHSKKDSELKEKVLIWEIE